MIVVVVAVVDLVAGPSEDPKLVIGSSVDEGDGDGSRSAPPGLGSVEEAIPNEVIVGRVGRRVDSKPIELRRGIDSRPPDGDRAAGFGQGQGRC